MLKYCLVVFLVLIPTVSGGLAQTRLPRLENKWEVSFFFGLNGIGDRRLATPVEGDGVRDVGLEFDLGHTLGLRVTENLGQHFGAELEYAAASKPFSLVNLAPSIPRLALDQRVHQLAYSLLIYSRDRDHRLRPFASVGLGASLFRIAGDSQQSALEQGVDLKNRWKMAFSYGAGLKYQRGMRWGLRLDFRDQVSGVPDFGLPRNAGPQVGTGGAGLRPEGVLHHWQISGGILYAFGIH